MPVLTDTGIRTRGQSQADAGPHCGTGPLRLPWLRWARFSRLIPVGHTASLLCAGLALQRPHFSRTTFTVVPDS